MHARSSSSRLTSYINLIVVGVLVSSCLQVGSPSVRRYTSSVLLDSIAALVGIDTTSDVVYGYDLIANTSVYFGPKGKLGHLTNGMDCQQCHRSAGSNASAFPLTRTFSSYPRMQKRSGTSISLRRRIADCFERSMHGTAPADGSREMSAILAYLTWLEQSADDSAASNNAADIAFLDRAADPDRGKKIFRAQCRSCHGSVGAGKLARGGAQYIYPPLWGDRSYNIGAGMYRLSRLATYILNNMPFGATYDSPMLSVGEAWDVAAYIAIQHRPTFDISRDWPHIADKPVDHPFGPFIDSLPERQHKFGPFPPILAAQPK